MSMVTLIVPTPFHLTSEKEWVYFLMDNSLISGCGAKFLSACLSLTILMSRLFELFESNCSIS